MTGPPFDSGGGKPLISVCMAVKDGEKFVSEQIASILPQISLADEVVVVDDQSEDRTLEIIRSFGDSRIRIHASPSPGIVSSFEAALKSARGTYFFLADQDDIWQRDKVSVMMHHLQECALVVSDCALVDEQLNVLSPSFHSLTGSSRGVFRNLLRNSYIGCCMGFHRRVLEKALPFPPGLPMHDGWLGLVADMCYQVRFIDDRLVLYRRHPGSYTIKANKELTPARRLVHRLRLIQNLLELKLRP